MHTHERGLDTNRALEVATAVSMTVGRGAAARLVADAAQVGPKDTVVDVGCGPGAAVREAARRGATVTGVDPSAPARRLGRWITSLRHIVGPTFVEGAAESLPLPDGSASVVWALCSVHHWVDPERGLAEARRVLIPGGRLLLVEGSVDPRARGHARHDLTTEGAGRLAELVRDAGFVGVQHEIRKARRRPLVVVTATAPSRRQVDTKGVKETP